MMGTKWLLVLLLAILLTAGCGDEADTAELGRTVDYGGTAERGEER